MQEKKSLSEAGADLAQRTQEWAEAFVRHKLADPKRTDGIAKAMADIEVDLRGAEIAWDIAKHRAELQRQQFEVQRLMLALGGQDDATEPTPETH